MQSRHACIASIRRAPRSTLESRLASSWPSVTTTKITFAGRSAPEHDQRGKGFRRVVGPAADIGAFEVQPVTHDTFGDSTRP